MKRLLACFLLGALCGGAITLAVMSKRMDDLYIMNVELIEGQDETTERIRILENKLAEYHRLIVVGIDFRYDSSPDTLDRLSLERQMRSVVNTLLGQAVREITLDTTLALLEGRIIAVDEKNYRVNVRAVVLAERVTYYLRISVHASGAEPDEP